MKWEAFVITLINIWIPKSCGVDVVVFMGFDAV
jgi:hypothetical protein